MKHLSYLIIIFLIINSLSISYGQETENRQVQSFDKIKTDGLVQVYLQEGDKESLRVEVKGVGLNDIITEVENGVLIVKTEGNYNGEDIKVYATYRQMKKIEVGGASKLYGKSTIKSKNLQVATSEAGDAFLTVDVGSLEISMEGAGNLTIAGKTRSEKINVKGRLNGTLDRTNLITSK